MRNRYRDLAITSLLTGCLLIALGLVLAVMPALAQEDTPDASGDAPPATAEAEDAAQPPVAPADGELDNAYCAVCHASTDTTVVFPDGTEMSVEVDPAVIAESVHGHADPAMGCTDCHGDKRYPHVDPLPASERLYSIQQSTLCVACHEEQAGSLVDSVHYAGLARGNELSATCVDCHGAHDVDSFDGAEDAIAATCGTCHVAVYEQYADSVHGQALLAGDMNSASCVDCHGVHGIAHPTTALFRNRSPQLCADCHADESLMAEYGITTNVFDSYLTDFHGTTVALFEQQDPNAVTNKAVCFDCHGVHNIQASDENTSRVARENLLDTCQECHPNASSNFPDTWVGHFPPTLESHPLMFTVDLFYTILIPTVVAGFIFLVLTDIIRRIRTRGRSQAEG